MKRADLRQFIEDGVNAINPTLGFGSGQIFFFDSNRSWKYPMVFHASLTETDTVQGKSAPNDELKIELWISQQGALDMTPTQYEPLIDECDDIARKLSYKYRNVVAGFKLTTMTNISRVPFVKKFADCLVGTTLSFTLNSFEQDDDVC